MGPRCSLLGCVFTPTALVAGRGGYGDGGILCSASDLLAYGSYWLSDDPAPLALSAAAKRSLVTPTVSAEARGSSVGLSWFISNPWEGSADSAVASYRMFSHVRNSPPTASAVLAPAPAPAPAPTPTLALAPLHPLS